VFGGFAFGKAKFAQPTAGAGGVFGRFRTVLTAGFLNILGLLQKSFTQTATDSAMMSTRVDDQTTQLHTNQPAAPRIIGSSTTPRVRR